MTSRDASIDPRPGRPRRKAWKVVAAGLALPPIAWVLVVTCLPMGWARGRIEAEIRERTGKSVHLAGVRPGLCGGLRLEGLRVAEPGREDVPWLRVHAIAIDLDLVRLALGKMAVREVSADGVDLTVRRRKDGSFDLADILRRPSRARSGRGDGAEDDAEVAFRLERSHVSVVDEPTDGQISLMQVQAEGSWRRDSASLTALRGQVNGGLVDLSARIDRGPGPLGFEGQMRAKGVRLGSGMEVVAYLVPLVGDASPTSKIDGKINLDLYLRGRGDSAPELRRSLAGHGRVELGPISLDRSEFVAELVRAAHLNSRDRLGMIQSDFELGGERVTTRDLTLRVGNLPMTLAGWTDFAGRIDYQIRVEALIEKLARESSRGLIEEIARDVRGVNTLRVQGTLRELTWTLDGKPLKDLDAVLSDRKLESKVREIGHRLRERYQR